MGIGKIVESFVWETILKLLLFLECEISASSSLLFCAVVHVGGADIGVLPPKLCPATSPCFRRFVVLNCY